MKSKNRIVKIGVILTVLSIVMAMISIVASAENTALPDMNHEASLTIHKYITKPDSPGTIPADGTEQVTIPAGAVVVKDVKFDIQKVVAKPASDTTSTVLYTDEYGVEYIAGGTVNEYTTDGDGEIVLDGEDFKCGIYLITEKASPDATADGKALNLATPVKPFIVSVPITDPNNGDAWLYDVHVYPKNETLTIDKSVDEKGSKASTAKIGETVTWIIDSTIPQGIETAKGYTITDVLDSRLDYTGSLEVKAFYEWADSAPADGIYEIPSGAAVITLIPVTDYTLTVPATGVSGGTIKVDLTKAGMEKLGVAYDHDGDSETDKVLPRILTVKFNTVINESAISPTGTGTAIENGATLEFKNEKYDENDPDDENTTTVEVPEKPEVHTGGVTLDKFDVKSQAKLAGAQFQIFATLDDALAQTNPIMCYVSDPASDTGYSLDDTMITDEDGFGAFYGLTYGKTVHKCGYIDGITGTQCTVTNGKVTAHATDCPFHAANTLAGSESAAKASRTYYIVEIQAPEILDADGKGTGKYYNLLKEPIEVTIDKGSHKVAIEVPNNKGIQLPITGGMGTIIFTVAGIALMGTAFALFIVLGKKKEKKA